MIRGKAKEELILEAYQKAFKKEARLGGCAACTFLAIQEILRLDQICYEAIFKGLTGLGGGVGRTAEGNCGGLTGGCLAIGLKFGRDMIGQEDQEAYYIRQERAFKLCQKLYDKYMEEYGTIYCKDIHKKLFGRTFDLWDKKDQETFEAAGSYVDKCTSVVGNSAKWTVEIILDEEEKNENT